MQRLKQQSAAVNAPIQLMRPHVQDVGRDFQIHYPRSDSIPMIGRYVGPADNDRYRFTTSRGSIEVTEDRIIGYRPTVGGMHPPGQERPVEENLDGRDQVFLSEADLSGAMSRQRRDPGLLDRMVVTTFEERPDYAQFEQNRRDLESQGVPILNSFDISDKEGSSKRLSRLPQNANLHFQMPRVPRSVKGYSTQKLVNDTLSLPKTMKRSDIGVSVTTPHPKSYSDPKTHNRFYGLESRKALNGTDMELQAEGSDSDEDLETYGYEHRQSTIDESAKVSKKRKKYKFVARKTEHEDFKHNPFEDSDHEGGDGGGDMQMGDLSNELVFG